MAQKLHGADNDDDQQQQQKLEFYCSYCDKLIEGIGLFYYVDSNTFYFDHYRCRYKFKLRYDTILKKRLLQLKRTKLCPCCTTTFIAITDRGKYCSNKCARKMRPKRYTTKNWCDNCNEWILKTDSIFVPKGTINK